MTDLLRQGLVKFAKAVNFSEVEGKILLIVPAPHQRMALSALEGWLSNVQKILRRHPMIVTSRAEIYITSENQAFGDLARMLDVQTVWWITGRAEKLRWLKSCCRRVSTIKIDDGGEE